MPMRQRHVKACRAVSLSSLAIVPMVTHVVIYMPSSRWTQLQIQPLLRLQRHHQKSSSTRSPTNCCNGRTVPGAYNEVHYPNSVSLGGMVAFWVMRAVATWITT